MVRQMKVILQVTKLQWISLSSMTNLWGLETSMDMLKLLTHWQPVKQVTSLLYNDFKVLFCINLFCGQS